MDPTFGLALALVLGVAPLPRVGTIQAFGPDDGFPSLYPRELLAADGALWVGIGATGNPEGLVRLDLARLDAGRVEARRFVHLDPRAPDGAPPDEVFGLARDRDGAIVAATSSGLYRSQGDAFEPISAPAAVRDVEAAADGSLWVELGKDGLFTAAPLGALDTLASRATCGRPLRLLPRSADECWLVCEGAILRAGPRGAFALDLTGTVLRREPGEEDDRPPVWITAAALSPEGGVFVLSQTGGLVRVAGDRIDRVIDDGTGAPPSLGGLHVPDHHLTDLLAEPSGDLLVGDTRGILTRWSPRTTETSPVWPLDFSFGFQNEVGSEARPLASTADGVFVRPDLHTGEGPTSIVRTGVGAFVTWPLRRPGATYIDPGILAALPDGHGGLYVSTNDGLWHLRP